MVDGELCAVEHSLIVGYGGDCNGDIAVVVCNDDVLWHVTQANLRVGNVVEGAGQVLGRDDNVSHLFFLFLWF